MKGRLWLNMRYVVSNLLAMCKLFLKTVFFRVFIVTFLIPLCVGVIGCVSSPTWTQILRGDIHSCIVLLGLIPNSFCLALLVCSVVCFLRKWAFLFILPAMTFAFLLDFAGLYAGIKYRMNISGDWILILQNTSWEELSRFFCSDFGVSGALLSMLSIGLIVVLSVWMVKGESFRSRRSVLIGVCCWLPFVVLRLLHPVALSEFTRYVGYAKDTRNALRMSDRIISVCQHPQMPEGWALECPKQDLPVLVFVIGESSSRCDWHLYGYRRETTPCMDELNRRGELIVFRDVVGVASGTARAIPALLLNGTIDKVDSDTCNLPAVLKEVGYRCVLISNQFAMAGDVILRRVFNGCEKMIKARGPDEPFDAVLLPYVKDELRKSEKPLALFVHMAGSHEPVREAYPTAWEKWGPDDVDACVAGYPADQRAMCNRYDNSIRYSDNILSSIVGMLDKMGGACLFYISDHGETPHDGRWRDVTAKAFYELPMFVWFSADYRKRFPETEKRYRAASTKRLQPDELFYGLLELAQVRCQAEGFTSDKFVPRKIRLINDGKSRY